MRKIVIAATLGILTIATAASAQTPGWGYGPEGQAVEQPIARPGGGRGGMFCNKGVQDPTARIARKLERMSARLGLNEAQKARIKAIMEEQHAKRVAQREETRSRILAVLDEGQRTQTERFMSQRCQGRGGRFGPGAGRGYGWGPGSGTGYMPSPDADATQAPLPATAD